MELKFDNVWGGPFSFGTVAIVFLVGLILLATWMLLRKATNPRVSGVSPALLLALLAWYGGTTVVVAKLGVQAGVDPEARNSSLALRLLVGWWLVSAASAFLLAKYLKHSSPGADA
jgi:hypothetical protein